MRIVVKGKKFTTEHIWFEDFGTIKHLESKSDRAVIHANTTKLTDDASLQYSLITDLANDEACIFDSFSSTVKNEIRRAEREQVVCEIYDSACLKISNEKLISFSEMYGAMYSQKGMDVRVPMNEINAYVYNDAFILSAAVLNNVPCVYHAYITDGVRTRLLYSCSEFRVKDNAMKNAIGRANKMLHWYDLRYFKGQNLSSYDWGGISSPDQPNGIDKFKMSFAGRPTQYYNCTIELSFMTKLLALYRKLFRKR